MDLLNLEVINFSLNMPIDIKPAIGRKWTTNGVNNEIFKMISDSYDDSPTNSAIINAYANYVYGEGLTNIANPNENLAKTDVNKHLSRADARLIVLDYKLFGGFAIQIIWNSAIRPEDKKPLLIKYIPISKLALNINKDMEVDSYWYCFDWMEQGRYRPKQYPKYTGKYVGNDIELLIIQRPSNRAYFSQPEWISGLPYARLEGQLANWCIQHTLNGFQGQKIINMNNGVPATEELMQEYKTRIIKQLTGTDNAARVIVSFNPDKDKGIVVEDINVPQLNEQYVQFALEAEKKLIVAHNAPAILFASSPGGAGLGNAANEVEMQSKLFYRKGVNPMREVILDGLQPIFTTIDPAIILGFVDFESYSLDNVDELKPMK